MTPRTAFVLPEAANVTVGVDTIAIVHDGDVELEQTLGRRLGRLEATGDVTLRRGRFQGTILAGGTLRLDADVDGEDLRGDVIEIGDVEVRARTIVASTRVVVGRAKLACDVIVAPEVHIASDASGRVRIVDCLNDRPPTKVRGCLSLEDYEADFGDVADFLARRGVVPVTSLPTAPPVDDEETDQNGVPQPAGEAAPLEDADDLTEEVVHAVATLDPEADDDADDAVVEVSFSEAPAAVSAAEDVDDVEELDDAVVEVIVHEDDEAGFAPSRPARKSRVVKQVEKAWERMQAAYGDDLPGTVGRIGELLAAGRAEQVADEIDALWLATLREHLEAGRPPPRVVTLAFHHIRAAAAAA